MVFDHALMFLSSGNLTIHSTLPSAGFKIRGTGVKGMAARIVIPGSHTTTKTFTAAVYVSEDDSTYTLAATLGGGSKTLAASTAAEYFIPFAIPKKKMYVKLEMTPAGAAAAALSLGAVRAGLVLTAHDEEGYDRTVDFA